MSLTTHMMAGITGSAEDNGAASGGQGHPGNGLFPSCQAGSAWHEPAGHCLWPAICDCSAEKAKQDGEHHDLSTTRQAVGFASKHAYYCITYPCCRVARDDHA